MCQVSRYRVGINCNLAAFVADNHGLMAGCAEVDT